MGSDEVNLLTCYIVHSPQLWPLTLDSQRLTDLLTIKSNSKLQTRNPRSPPTKFPQICFLLVITLFWVPLLSILDSSFKTLHRIPHPSIPLISQQSHPSSILGFQPCGRTVQVLPLGLTYTLSCSRASSYFTPPIEILTMHQVSNLRSTSV